MYPLLSPRGPVLGLAVLALAAVGPDATAQVTVRISEGMAVQAYDVDIALAGTVEATGTLDTRGSTITLTQTDGSGGITLGGGLRVALTDLAAFEGTTISGPVQLEGTLRIGMAPDTDLDPGSTFTVLTCTGGCSGTFDQIDAPFDVDVTYVENAVAVTVLESFTTPTEDGPGVTSPVVLHAPYPNPFSEATTLQLDLEAGAHVRVEAFDPLGRRVATVSDAPLPSGSHTLQWSPAGLGSGVYFVSVRVDDEAAGVWRVALAR